MILIYFVESGHYLIKLTLALHILHKIHLASSCEPVKLYHYSFDNFAEMLAQMIVASSTNLLTVM